MRLQRILLPAIALGGAATLLLPGISEGFSTIGGLLSITQRDVRVFDNFTNPGANDNVTPDANTPGWVGAEMAIWKSVLEWGSMLHGLGNGDPHQPAGLGSGGANFDAAWGGAATSAGTTNQNVMSLIGGCGGGVLAYTETPINDGWRIFFCNSWTWADGPGTSVSGIDIQGVSCHEYGHALGLGHSAVSGATMYPSISGSGVGARSIAADDIAGVQFVYGVAGASKPRITGLTTGIGTVTISGQNFGASGLEVWFTRSTASNPTDFGMLILTGQTSTGGGTQINCAVPAGAGSGDIMVKNSGTGGVTLSNAFPFDASGSTCASPTNFCFSGANSVSASGANITSSGSTSVAANDFVLETYGLPANKTCLYLYSDTQISAVAFGEGFRCINPIRRIYPAATSSGFGDLIYPLDIGTLPPADPINAGDTQYFMCWYRDPAGGGSFYNASDALETHWCP